MRRDMRQHDDRPQDHQADEMGLAHHQEQDKIVIEPSDGHRQGEDDDAKRKRHAAALVARIAVALLSAQLWPREWRASRRTISATSAVHPVWWEAPRPSPVSPWKYS